MTPMQRPVLYPIQRDAHLVHPGDNGSAYDGNLTMPSGRKQKCNEVITKNSFLFSKLNSITKNKSIVTRKYIFLRNIKITKLNYNAIEN